MCIGEKMTQKALECTTHGLLIQTFSGGGPPDPPGTRQLEPENYHSYASLSVRLFIVLLFRATPFEKLHIVVNQI